MKSQNVNVQMKATEQYFPVVLFIMLYKVVLTFESVDEIQKCVTVHMKANEQSFFLEPFIVPFSKVGTKWLYFPAMFVFH